MEEQIHTSAVVLPSTCWDDVAVENRSPAEGREDVAAEAFAWQNIAHFASDRVIDAVKPGLETVANEAGESVTKLRGGLTADGAARLQEMLGLMGAIGEQVGLAWTFEQDAQRLMATETARDPDDHRVALRAVSEAAGYFTLGACHSMANVVVRLLMFNPLAAEILRSELPDSTGFAPESDSRYDWVSLDQSTIKRLGKGERAAGNQAITQAVEAVRNLRRSNAFKSLELRRGMDYHRRRPQSRPHTAPRMDRGEDPRWIRKYTPHLDPEADATAVHDLVVAALGAAGTAMTRVRAVVPEALRGEGIRYSN